MELDGKALPAADAVSAFAPLLVAQGRTQAQAEDVLGVSRFIEHEIATQVRPWRIAALVAAWALVSGWLAIAAEPRCGRWGLLVPVAFGLSATPAIVIDGRRRLTDALTRQQSLWSVVAETMDEGLLLVDDRERIIGSNSASQRIFGCSRQEMQGKPVEFQLNSSPPIEPSAKSGESIILAKGRYIQGRRHDGTVFSMDVELRPLGPKGPCRSVWIIRDLTERREREVHLVRISKAFHSASDAILIADNNGQALHVNPAFRRITGFSASQLNQFGGARALFSDPHVRREMLNAVSGGGSWGREVEVPSSGGHRVLVSLRVNAIIDETKRPLGFIAVATDISEQRRAQQALDDVRARWKAILDAATEIGIVATDLEGRITVFNRGAELMFGQDAEQAAGQSLDRFSGDLTLQTARSEDRTEIECQLRRADGSTFHGSWLITCLRNSRGEPSGFLAIVRDLSERARIQKELRDNQKLLEMIFESAGVGICLVNEEGRYVRVNRTYQSITGYAKKELEGESIAKVLPPALQDAGMDLHYRFFEDGGRKDLYFQLRRKDGSLVDVAITGGMMCDESGQRFRISTIVDNSEKARAERELRENERLLEAIFETIQVGVALTDGKHRLVRANKAFGRIFGYEGRELIGQTIARLLRPQDRESALRSLHAFATGDAQLEQEWQCQRKDGREIDAYVTAGRMDRDNERPYSVLAFADVTERNQAAALRSRLTAIIEATSDLVLTSDLNGGLSYINAAGLKMLGLAGMNEAQTLTLGDLTDSKLRSWFLEQALPHVIREGIWSGENILRTRDGRSVPVSQVVFTHQTQGGGPGLISTIARDITDRKNSECALQAAKEAAEAANLAKGAFLATMSHEIRTPMNAVIGMNNLLMQTPLTNEQREYASAIRSSGNSLLSLINDILDFSKIESGRLEIERRPFEVRECVDHSVEILANAAASKGLRLVCSIAPDVPDIVTGDCVRLGQVLTNLLANAVKFTEAGEVRIEAAPAVAPEGRVAVAFAVTDTGIGIPADRMDRLFRSFSQVDDSIHRKYGGTGLGLAISQRLVGLMGGSLQVQSEEGAGSRFEFTLPLGEPRDAESPPPRWEPASDALLNPMMAEQYPLAILIAEDIAVNQRLMLAMLAKLGYKADLAANGLEVLKALKNQRYELILMDVRMPHMSGVEAARRIMADYRPGERPRIIALTANALREDRDECLEAGMDAYLSKPFQIKELVQALKQAAEHWRLVRESASADSDSDTDTDSDAKAEDVTSCNPR